jgi:hypothetical protein
MVLQNSSVFLSFFLLGMLWTSDFVIPIPADYIGLQRVKELPKIDLFTAIFNDRFFHLVKSETSIPRLVANSLEKNMPHL